MTTPAGRDAMIDEMLQLLPPRTDDAREEAHHLRIMEGAELERRFGELKDAAASIAARNQDYAKPAPSRERRERRALAESQLREGLAKLDAAEAKFRRAGGRAALDRAAADGASRGWVARSSDFEAVPGRLAPTLEVVGAAGRLESDREAPVAGRSFVDDGRKDEIPFEVDRRSRDALIDSVAEVIVDDVMVKCAAFDRTETALPDIESVKAFVNSDAALMDYFEFIHRKIIFDVLKLMQQNHPAAMQGASPAEEPAQESVDEDLDRLSVKSMVERLQVPSSMSEQIFLSDKPAVVSEPNAVNALAQIISKTKVYRPDLIVVPDVAGAITGRLVSEESGFDVVYGLEGIELAASRRPFDVKRILLIDDISRSGETLSRYFEKCWELFDGCHVEAMALVGSLDSVARFGRRAFFPTVSPERGATLPWNTSGELKYEAEGDAIVLGAGRSDSLAIPRQLLRRSVDRLMTFERRGS